VYKLRRALVGLVGKVPKPTERWDRPKRQQTKKIVHRLVNLPLKDVHMPDLIGVPLIRSVRLLLQAGLETDPEIVLVEGKTENLNRVFKTIPKMRTVMPAHSRVVLYVVNKSKKPNHKDRKPGNSKKLQKNVNKKD
jgi:hypothetical protein